MTPCWLSDPGCILWYLTVLRLSWYAPAAWGICSQLIKGNSNYLIKFIWRYAPFAQTPTNSLRRRIFGNVGNNQPSNVILFCDRKHLWNLRSRLSASIICQLSLGLPLFYCSSRIWPVTLVPLWLLWFLCAPYIPVLLNHTEKEG